MDIRRLLRSPSPEGESLPVAETRPNHTTTTQSVALLSKTVFRSPIIKWILPARIRGLLQNDVIFIGEDFIELKEIVVDGRIRHRALRSDFASGIYAAQILGTRPESRAIEEEAQIQNHRHTNGLPSEVIHLPPQVLLLTLKSGDLVFITASTDENITTFSTHTHPLPIMGEESPLKELGHLIAVDPNSRAIAVAAFQSNLLLSKIKPSDEQAALKDLPGDMILYETGMTILRMEFLYPSPSDNAQVILLIVGDAGIQVLGWDNDHELTSDGITTRPYRFGPELKAPSLVIPLKGPGSFMMVTEPGLSIFCDAHIGSLRNASWYPRTRDDDPPRFPGLSPRPPIWTNWARPMRGEHYFYDDIYLAREDGVVWWLRVAQNSGNLSVTDQTTAGVLESNIGTAFAVLDLHIEDPDVLLSGGDLCDGGVYMLGQSFEFGNRDEQSRMRVMQPDLKDIICNWAPFTDIAVIDDRPLSRSSYSHIQQPSRIHRPQVYATTGKGPNGAVSELRHGLQLLVSDPIASDELENASRMWPLQGMDCVVLSYPEHSSVMYGISSGSPEMVPINNERTLAVAVLERPSNFNQTIIDTIGITLRVTTSSIHLLRLDPLNPIIEFGPVWSFSGITVAAVEPLDFLIILATREDRGNSVQLKKFTVTEGNWHLFDIGHPILFDEEPSCIGFFRDENPQSASSPIFATLGTESGSFHILKADTEHGLSRLLSQSLMPANNMGLTAACESVSIIVHPKASPESPMISLLALCGMRDGVLHAVELRFSHAGGDFRIAKQKAIVIGQTPVRAVPDVFNLGCAIIYCDTQVLYLYCGELSIDTIRIVSVWFTNQTNRALTNSSILDICQVPTVSESHGSLCRLACITKTALLIGQLDDIPKPLPRPLRVSGTPSRVVYLQQQKLLLVASTTIVTETQPVRKRYPLFALTLIRPSESERADFRFEKEPHIDFGVQPHYIGAPGERFTGVLEWNCSDGRVIHQYLIVSTMNATPTRTGTETAGNIVFFRLVHDNEGKLKIKHDKIKGEYAPVTAICQYGPHSLVYCSGSQLWMRVFSFDTRAFERRPLIKLHSPGIFITAQPPFVYVTTKQHSILVFKFDHTGNLHPFASDNIAREGLAHLVLPSQALLMLSDKRGSIAAIRLPGPGEPREVLTTVFEAKLPCSITRICKAAIRPPWKESHVPGVVERDLLGISTDGSLLSFNLLEGASWRLLKFIQNMCMREERICEFPPLSYDEDVHLEPQGKEPADFHVDGDVLGRLVEVDDALQLFNNMLDKIPADNADYGSRIDYDTADRRRARFKELVDELLNGPPASPNNVIELARRGLDSLNDDPVEFSLSYIRAVLDSPF